MKLLFYLNFKFYLKYGLNNNNKFKRFKKKNK